MKLTNYFGDWLKVIDMPELAKVVTYINSKLNTIIKVNHPAFYARTGLPMPNNVFTEINFIIIGNYGTPI